HGLYALDALLDAGADAVHLALAVLVESRHPRRCLYPVYIPYGHLAHVLVGLRYVAAVWFETSVVDNHGPSCGKPSPARLAKQLAYRHHKPLVGKLGNTRRCRDRLGVGSGERVDSSGSLRFMPTAARGALILRVLANHALALP
ncbi:unnamed protein product, partial [Laminaria digitata]